MNLNTILPAEWAEQDAVLLAWPHADTDWCDMLVEVVECYKHIAEAILATEPLIVVTPEVGRANADLRNIESASPNPVYYYRVPTNDTWARLRCYYSG